MTLAMLLNIVHSGGQRSKMSPVNWQADWTNRAHLTIHKELLLWKLYCGSLSTLEGHLWYSMMQASYLAIGLVVWSVKENGDCGTELPYPVLKTLVLTKS